MWVSIMDDTHKLVKKLTQTSYFSLRLLFSDKLLVTLTFAGESGKMAAEIFLKAA
ncbi:hypothetical protein MNBD_GAMMA02-188 [hydrothermal vent metagenome]|uniref:Uncharacterized protein n=1 Tax=hydrothermal vent metagenome TaxID=652676 RepID=A0A3B0W7X0_9ZZZZ